MGGAELLKKIKEDARLENMPVVVLTNSFVTTEEKRFLELGADLYLIKIENSPKDVISKISNIINNKVGVNKQ